MNADNSIYFGMNGVSYQIGSQIGVGGEGTVYVIQGRQLVAKIYKQVNPEIEGKLRYMVQHPIPQVMDQYGNPILRAAWPLDILYDRNRNFVGYVMPRVETGVELLQIQRGSASAAVQAKFPDYSWRLNVVVARNLAASVNALHSCGYVLGDMNCKNYMVNADGSISLLDTDSIDMTDPVTGTHYKCCVGIEEYLPPELQGRYLRNPAACFTRETDNFALAVHIFQLLMNNYHPFSARQTVQKGSSSANPRMDRIVAGKCPYLNQYSDVTIPVGAPRLEDVLPQYMIDAFRNTFDYTASNAAQKIQSRTTAQGWLQVLKRLLREYDENCIVFPTPMLRTEQQTMPEHRNLQFFGKLCAAGNIFLILRVVSLNLSSQNYGAAIFGALIFFLCALSIVHKNYLLSRGMRDIVFNNSFAEKLYLGLGSGMDTFMMLVLADIGVMMPFLLQENDDIHSLIMCIVFDAALVYHILFFMAASCPDANWKNYKPKLHGFGGFCILANLLLAIPSLSLFFFGMRGDVGVCIGIIVPMVIAMVIWYKNSLLVSGKRSCYNKYMKRFCENWSAVMHVFVFGLFAVFMLPGYVEVLSGNKAFWLGCVLVGVLNIIYFVKHTKAMNS